MSTPMPGPLQQALARQLARAAASYKVPEVPRSSNPFEGLRAVRGQQHQTRLNRLRTGS